jgi:hypothetical protein
MSVIGRGELFLAKTHLLKPVYHAKRIKKALM